MSADSFTGITGTAQEPDRGSREPQSFTSAGASLVWELSALFACGQDAVEVFSELTCLLSGPSDTLFPLFGAAEKGGEIW
jgi:hypothetical protein